MFFLGSEAWPVQIPFDRELVVYRLEEAGRTLLSLPGKGCVPAGMRSFWPDVFESAFEAYGYTEIELRPPVPEAAAIDRMDEAFLWMRHIAPDRRSHRRIVLMRSLVSPRTERHIWSWRKIGDACGWSHTAVRMWHGEAIDWIVGGINRLADNPSGIRPGLDGVPSYVRGVATGRERP